MSAPPNNLFALGNTGGRPPKFKTPEEMANKIAEYIEYEDSLKRPDTYSKAGKGVYTLSGCALFLGFASVQSMYDYEKVNQEFSYIIGRFKQFMTHWNEQKLYWAGTMPGAKFWLTNWGGYKDERHEKSDSTIHVAQLNVESVKSDTPLAPGS
jgi:hypothetical protein